MRWAAMPASTLTVAARSASAAALRVRPTPQPKWLEAPLYRPRLRRSLCGAYAGSHVASLLRNGPPDAAARDPAPPGIPEIAASVPPRGILSDSGPNPSKTKRERNAQRINYLMASTLSHTTGHKRLKTHDCPPSAPTLLPTVAASAKSGGSGYLYCRL